MMHVPILLGDPAPHTKRGATQRSKFENGRADARAGSVSISSSSSGASGMGASSLSLRMPRGLRERAPSRWWRGTHGGRGVPRPLRRPRGNRRPSVRVIDAIPCSRPCSRRRGPSLREPPRPMTGVWMQLLKLRKTATSHGCKYDVLRGGRNGSTT